VGSSSLGERLRTCQQEFTQLFGSLPVGVIAASLAGGEASRYLAVSDSFCQQTGYSRSELNGKDILTIIHPEEQPLVDELISSIAAGESTQVNAGARIVDRDGNVLNTRLTGGVIEPPGGARYLAISCENVTDITSLRSELRQLQDELAQSRRREGLVHLAEGIAHDFNNLLTVISSYSSLVQDEITIAEASQGTSRWGPVRWDVRQIEEATGRAKRLVAHMMAFSRQERFEPQLADLNDQVSDAIVLLDEVLGDQITISKRSGRALWQVDIDTNLLRQAIINLALNARDAMPAGGQIEVAIDNVDTTDSGWPEAGVSRPELEQLGELLPGRYVAIRVSDTGTGMDPVVADRAFEPFFTTKNDDDGAGLGLSAVRTFAARSSGRTWLTSQPGQGTTVTIILPAAPGSSAIDPDRAGQRTSSGTIVVADDELAMRDVVHRVLTSAGYAVMTAANGADALALLADQAIPADLLLVDVVMPGITSQDFIIRARKLRPGIRILFMSGYQRPDDVSAWPDPSFEVIAKPFARSTLLVRVQQAMASAATGDQAAPPLARRDRLRLRGKLRHKGHAVLRRLPGGHQPTHPVIEPTGSQLSGTFARTAVVVSVVVPPNWEPSS